MPNYYKIERPYFLQLFKIISVVESAEIKYHKYSSIIIDHLKDQKIRTMNDYMSESDYHQLTITATQISQDEMTNLLIEKLPNEGLDSLALYNEYYEIFIDYYRAKRLSRINTDKIIKENQQLDFYTVIEEQSVTNLVYDKKDYIVDLKRNIQSEESLVKQFLFQKAHTEAVEKYIKNKIIIQ